MVHEQLALGVQLRDEATFENFYVGANSQLLASLQQLPGTEDPYLYLYGGAGSGRSHLLQALCHHTLDQGLQALYLPLRELSALPPDVVLEQLDALSVLCLDDLDAVAGLADWEEALFHLYNRLRQNGAALVLSSSCSVRELALNLADLRSRLSWGMVFQLHYQPDQALQIFRFRAEKRGLQISDELANYLLARVERDTPALLALLDRLDRASLRERRRLTIPFVKAELGW